MTTDQNNPAISPDADIRPLEAGDIENIFAGLEPAPAEVLRALQAKGVQLEPLLERWHRHPHEYPRWAKATFERGGFEFAKEGDQKSEGALLWLALSEAGDPIDLVAWTPRKKPAALVGRASMLNPAALSAFSVTDSVRVDSAPIAWLKAGARGVLVIDLDRAALTLMDAESIEVTSPDAARKVRAAFEKLLPSITIAKAAKPSPTSPAMALAA